MAKLIGTSEGFLRDRELFFHDGAHLRKIRLPASLQVAVVALLMALLAWSAYATSRMATSQPAAAVPADMAGLAAATELRARQIEQRQEVLAAMLAGEEVDPSALPVTDSIAPLPAALAGKFARLDERDAALALAAKQELDKRYAATAREFRKLGLNPARLAQGGPFEPVKEGDATFKELFTSWKKLDRLQDSAIAVPSDKPVRLAGLTSGFGVRSDPFRRGRAMHAGIDLAGPHGTPIYATADGVVTDAGFNSGGYGNLVKLSHGKGIETRYGHLSSIQVKPGQRVTRGMQIGRMGSTGRSTGSHLHYEVRIDGRAVNPIPFMKSTDYIVAMQEKGGTHSMDSVALGGPNAAKR